MRVVTERTLPPAPAPPMAAGQVGAPGLTSRAVVAAALAGAVLTALALALSTQTGMWLDEAQALAIARLPLPDLLDALRRDGAPPLYYLLLHGWTNLFGGSELAARSLSAVFATGAIALAPLAGARIGGRRAALATFGLVATSPFLHRYGTEARMYSLVVLLVLAGFLLLSAALERPTPATLAGVGAVSGLLLLTHYWSVFLLAVVAALLVVRGRRPAGGDPARLTLLAMAAGAVLFVPWTPSFLFQLRHTGAPWGVPGGADAFEDVLAAFAGGEHRVGILGFLLAGLSAVGLLGRPRPAGRIELDLAGRPEARPLAAAAAGTLVLGLLASQLSGSAFAPRYAAVVLVPFLLLSARGLASVEHRVAVVLLAVAVAGAGLARSASQAGAARTQARDLAAAVNSAAQPGDVVAFCPDQLAPAVVRLLDVAVSTASYPPGSPPERVDWVDYRDRVGATPGTTFAGTVLDLAGPHQVWLAWAPGYHSLGRSCEAVLQHFRQVRPGGRRVQAQDRQAFEHASLWRFPPTHNP